MGMRHLPSRRTLLVVGIALLAILWIVSGALRREPTASRQSMQRGVMAVAVEWRQAQPVQRILTLQGQVEPDQLVIVRAETAGRIESWQVERGAAVGAGEEIARLGIDDREARRRQALARVRERRENYRAIRQLVEEGFAAPQEEQVRLAELQAARAELEAIEQELAHTRVTAPIAGMLNRRLAERGEYVAVGGEIAEIVDNDPLRVVGQVPQHQIGRARIGLPGQVRFINGATAEGEVVFISTLADPVTRTFRVEVLIPNPEQALPSGISAEIVIPTAEVMAHKLSPALLTLDDSGRVGAMAVNGDNRVEFHPVEVVRAEPDGIWVLGLPDEVRLITVGQGFVTPGEEVDPREEPAVVPATSDGVPP
jgi:membrane fusion protein, multidrug efflux system